MSYSKIIIISKRKVSKYLSKYSLIFIILAKWYRHSFLPVISVNPFGKIDSKRINILFTVNDSLSLRIIYIIFYFNIIHYISWIRKKAVADSKENVSLKKYAWEGGGMNKQSKESF